MTDASADVVGSYLRSLIGRAAHQRIVASNPVSAPAVRSWNNAMGRRQPFADDATKNASGCAEPEVPMATLAMWTMPGLEPGRPLDAGPARAGDLDEEVRKHLAEFGYGATLATSTEQEFLSPLRVGDTVVAEDEYTATSAQKQTALGEGYFVSSRTTYRTETGRVVGRMAMTVFHFRPYEIEGLPDPLPAPPEPFEAAEHGVATVLSAGLVLGPVRIPVTPTLIIAGALATGDFYPVHHDRDFARSLGNPDMVMNILTTNGLLARVVGEWTSEAQLLALATRLRSTAHPYDVLSLSGTVGAVGDGRAEIAISAATARRPHAEAVATVRIGNEQR